MDWEKIRSMHYKKFGSYSRLLFVCYQVVSVVDQVLLSPACEFNKNSRWKCSYIYDEQSKKKIIPIPPIQPNLWFLAGARNLVFGKRRFCRCNFFERSHDVPQTPLPCVGTQVLQCSAPDFNRLICVLPAIWKWRRRRTLCENETTITTRFGLLCVVIMSRFCNFRSLFLTSSWCFFGVQPPFSFHLYTLFHPIMPRAKPIFKKIKRNPASVERQNLVLTMWLARQLLLLLNPHVHLLPVRVLQVQRRPSQE